MLIAVVCLMTPRNPDRVKEQVLGGCAKVQLPESWTGQRNAERAAMNGVPDRVFCYKNLVIARVRSCEGAVKRAGTWRWVSAFSCCVLLN